MSDTPQISIVTPCLNPGERLKRCLDSVRAQTNESWEHLIVDAGSTDGTVELLQKTSRIRWISEPDKGQADAINKGFLMASGRILGWLNADDTLHQHAVASATRALSGHIGWVYGDVEVVENGLRRLWRPPSDPERHILRLGKGGVIPQPGSFVARWALEKIGPLDASLHLAFDFDMWLRLIDAGIPGRYIPETMATFEIHADSKTGSKGLGPFFVEEAQAFMKIKRPRQASLALGRAAAQAYLAARASSPAGLAEEIDRVVDGLAERGWVDLDLVRASALTEAALAGGRASMRLLARSQPWRAPETRARIVGAIGKKLRGETGGTPGGARSARGGEPALPRPLRETLPSLATFAFVKSLQKALAGCQTILDVGCGTSSPIRFVRGHTVGIDVHEPSLEQARAARTHHEFKPVDAREISQQFGPKSFDAAVALDVIEHLDRAEGLALCAGLETVARKKVAIFTPNGFLPQKGSDGDFQEHRSSWSVADFEGRGYRVIGMGGLRALRGEYHRLRWRPRALWAAVSFLSHALYTKSHPEHAAALLAVKELR